MAKNLPYAVQQSSAGATERAAQFQDRAPLPHGYRGFDVIKRTVGESTSLAGAHRFTIMGDGPWLGGGAYLPVCVWRVLFSRSISSCRHALVGRWRQGCVTAHGTVPSRTWEDS
nr:hypothetical protein CFP56_57897 [Quercus suber]